VSEDESRAEPFSNLLRRFGVADSLEDAEVIRVSFASAFDTYNDPFGILGYLAGIGIVVRSLDDLMQVNGIADEEDLSAYRVAEGVAVTVASQGDWILFQP
jgi:hypothetical protein